MKHESTVRFACRSILLFRGLGTCPHTRIDLNWGKAYGEPVMRSNSSVLACVTQDRTCPLSIEDGVRALVELIPRPKSELGNPAEEVLIDIEVDGQRYLVLRMPKPGRNRIQLSPREAGDSPNGSQRAPQQ